MLIFVKGNNKYPITSIIRSNDGRCNNILFNGRISVAKRSIPHTTNILVFLILGYFMDETISSAIITIIINISAVCLICENNSKDNINDDTGIGNPTNVFVGPTCSVIMVLYLLNLRIPQHNRRTDAIIIISDGNSSYIITAGEIPKDMASASESIVSPKTSLVSFGKCLAKGPSTASKITANTKNIAQNIEF